jgi:hypothetical protein
MLDIETLNTEAGAVMLSLAAVQFDEHTGETGAEFYQKISLQNSIDLGLTINADTLKWWLDKDREVLNEALSGTKPLAEVLVDFSSWFNNIKLQHGKVSIWGNSARFDCGIVEAGYKKLNLPIPWDSWLEVCFRTFIRDHKELRKSIPFVGNKHLPIDDCKHQIQTVFAINNLKK